MQLHGLSYTASAGLVLRQAVSPAASHRRCAARRRLSSKVRMLDGITAVQMSKFTQALVAAGGSHNEALHDCCSMELYMLPSLQAHGSVLCLAVRPVKTTGVNLHRQLETVCAG